MKTAALAILLQTALLLGLAPLVSGIIKNWKAKLQNRQGPRVWQPYLDLRKFLRKDMVISEHTSWVFSFAPYVVFLTALLAGLLVPMLTEQAPLSLFGGVLAFVGLLALGRFFLALGGLDPASAFGGMGSSREMTIAAIAEPALMLAIFTVAIAARTTDLSGIVRASLGPDWSWLNPMHVLAFAALFIVLLAETGRIPIDNPGDPPRAHDDPRGDAARVLGPLPGVHGVGRRRQAARADDAARERVFPFGIADTMTAEALGLSLLAYLAKLVLLAGIVVVVETTNAKLRLFRVPDLLSAAFVLAALALFSTFLFQ
jgi:formate hydrogenlyase subunit 4